MPNPFISQQDLTEYLGRDVTQDAGALIAVDAACEIVRTISEQQFNRGTTTFVLDGTGTDAILLPELPVNAAGTVVVNGEAITEYSLNTNGILFRGTSGCDPRPVWPKGRQNIVITADHGYETVDVPREVRQVALSLAARIVVQGVAIEEQVGSQRIKYAGPATDLGTTEKIILGKYRQTR